MTEKTIQETIQEHQRRAVEIVSNYRDKIQKLTERNKIDDPFADRLAPEEHFRLLQEEKQREASALYAQTVEAYTEEVSRFHGEVQLRKAEIEAQLFGLASPEATAALAQAAAANDDQLERMLDVALTSFNPDLAKTAFVAAHQRGRADLVNRYFGEFDEEARSLYGELQEVPSEEMLSRQAESAERIVEPAAPEQLAGTPRVGA